MADTLKYAIGNAASTTLSSSVSTGDTSMILTSDTNFAAKSGEGMVLVDEGTATEELAYSTSKTGATLATALANRGLEGGSAQAHVSTATIKGVLTAGMWNDMIDALTNVLLKTTGAVDTTKVVTLTATQTLTNKTLTTPVIASISNSGTVTLPTGAETLVGRATTDTLTNKRITKRITTITSSATPTINTDNCDCVTITAQAAAITSMTTNLSGTPTNFQPLVIRILDDGTGRAITWGASFASKGATLPTTTTASKLLTVGFLYNTVTSKWECVASVEET